MIEEMVDATAKAPDSIEPIEQWRVWTLDRGGDGWIRLCSVNGTVWPPGEPLVASCEKVTNRWIVVPSHRAPQGLLTLEAAQEWWDVTQEAISNYYAAQRGMFSISGKTFFPPPPPYADTFHGLSRPTAELPPGLAYVTEPVRHEAPNEDCSCGIYAGETLAQCPGPPSGIYGTVKMWGKIVPGQVGARAQYAYPSKLYAPDAQTAKALEVYGVPVEVTGKEMDDPFLSDLTAALTAPIGYPTSYRRPDWLRRLMLGALVLNLGAFVLNIGSAMHHWGWF
jgi:hypothetical protein